MPLAAPVERVGEPGGRVAVGGPLQVLARRGSTSCRGAAGTGRRELTEAEGVPVEAVDVGEEVHEVALHALAARPVRRRGADRP